MKTHQDNKHSKDPTNQSKTPLDKKAAPPQPTDEILDDDQKLIRTKFISYLKIKDKEYKANDETNRLRLSLESGHCVGFADAHGVMDEFFDKLDWWEAALYEITQWDDKAKDSATGLKKLLFLPNANTKKPVTLDEIILRAMYYTVIPQSNAVTQLFRTTEYDIPISDGKKEVSLQRNEEVAGHFTKEQLLKLLDEKDMKQSVCTIGGDHEADGFHGIRIGYRGNGQWLVYDPNYKHNKKGPIHKVFTKSKMIDEVTSILSNTLSIRIYSPTKSKKSTLQSEYDKLLVSNLPGILQEGGLTQICMLTDPGRTMKYIFKRAETDAKTAEALTQALIRAPKNTPGATGLKALVGIRPEYFHQIPIAMNQFPDLVHRVFMEGLDSFETPFSSSSEFYRVQPVLERAAYNLRFLSVLINMLEENAKQGGKGYKIIGDSFQSILYRFDLYDLNNSFDYNHSQKQSLLKKMLGLAMLDRDGYENILIGLETEYNTGHIKGLVAEYEDEKGEKSTLPVCLETLVTNRSDILAPVMETVCKELNEHKFRSLMKHPRLLALMACHLPDHFAHILRFTKRDPNAAEMLGAMLAKVNDQDKTSGLYQFITHAPDQLPKIIEIVARDNRARVQLCEALTFQVKNKTCFQHIINNTFSTPELVTILRRNMKGACEYTETARSDEKTDHTIISALKDAVILEFSKATPSVTNRANPRFPLQELVVSHDEKTLEMVLQSLNKSIKASTKKPQANTILKMARDIILFDRHTHPLKTATQFKKDHHLESKSKAAQTNTNYQFKSVDELKKDNSDDAKFELAYRYEYGMGIKKDEKQAMEIYASIEKRRPDAKYHYTKLEFYQLQHPTPAQIEAFSTYMKSQSNNADALNYCAEMDNERVRLSDEKLKAYEKEHSEKKRALSTKRQMTKLKASVKNHLESSIKNYRKSAAHGGAHSMCAIAEMHEKGNEFIQKDELVAFDWYQKAAHLGYPYAMYQLAAYYMEGTVVSKDRRAARFLIQTAANLGHVPSMQSMSSFAQDDGNTAKSQYWEKKIMAVNGRAITLPPLKSAGTPQAVPKLSTHKTPDPSPTPTVQARPTPASNTHASSLDTKHKEAPEKTHRGTAPPPMLSKHATTSLFQLPDEAAKEAPEKHRATAPPAVLSKHSKTSLFQSLDEATTIEAPIKHQGTVPSAMLSPYSIPHLFQSVDEPVKEAPTTPSFSVEASKIIDELRSLLRVIQKDQKVNEPIAHLAQIITRGFQQKPSEFLEGLRICLEDETISIPAKGMLVVILNEYRNQVSAALQQMRQHIQERRLSWTPVEFTTSSIKMKALFILLLAALIETTRCTLNDSRYAGSSLCMLVGIYALFPLCARVNPQFVLFPSPPLVSELPDDTQQRLAQQYNIPAQQPLQAAIEELSQINEEIQEIRDEFDQQHYPAEAKRRA